MTNFFNAYMKEEMTIEEAYASVVHMRSKLDDNYESYVAQMASLEHLLAMRYMRSKGYGYVCENDTMYLRKY